jgi:HD-like signal output (HDOD) protein
MALHIRKLAHEGLLRQWNSVEIDYHAGLSKHRLTQINEQIKAGATGEAGIRHGPYSVIIGACSTSRIICMPSPVQSSQEEDQLIAGSVMKDLAIPPRPAVILVLQKELAQKAPDLVKIKKTIAADVGLAAALLKTVNSAAFGLSRKISSVPQAIDIVGLRNIGNIAMAMALRQQMAKNSGESLERFWDSAEKVALLCAHFARKLKGVSTDEAYTYGLFHNCGIAVLMHRFPNYREALMKANQVRDKRFTSVEELMVGTNHAIVGYFLARSWSLNESLCQAILLHHEHDVYDAEVHDNGACHNYVAIGHLSEHVHHQKLRSSEDPEWAKFHDAFLAHFGLDAEEFTNLIDSAEE